MGKRTHHQRAGMTVKRIRFLTKKGPSGVAGKDYSALRGVIQEYGVVKLLREHNLERIGRWHHLPM
ncbi:hypothetical protein EVH22_22885 [Salmonella enterica subsp. enterica serovar Bareilly]|nr:hypothetical protein [Salmonella enterica subsp. enterica serovar Bareilly]